MAYHQGHRALLIDVFKSSPQPLQLPLNASIQTVTELEQRGRIKTNLDVMTGRTYLLLTPDGERDAKELTKQADAKEDQAKERRTAKERALHKMGHTIRELTEFDVPSDKSLDQSIEWLGYALQELARVREL